MWWNVGLVVLLFVALTVVPLVFLYLRRRWLTGQGGAFDCAMRHGEVPRRRAAMVSRVLTLDAPCIAAAARADSLQRSERTQPCRLVSAVRRLIRTHCSRRRDRAQLLLRGRARRRHRTHELDGSRPSRAVPTVGASHTRVDPAGCGFDTRQSGRYSTIGRSRATLLPIVE